MATSRIARGSTAAARRAVPQSVGRNDPSARRSVYDAREYELAVPEARAALRTLQRILSRRAPSPKAVAQAARTATHAAGRLWDAARRLSEPL